MGHTLTAAKGEGYVGSRDVRSTIAITSYRRKLDTDIRGPYLLPFVGYTHPTIR